MNVILFLLLMFRDLEGSTSDLFLGVLNLCVKVLVLSTHGLNRVFESLDLEACISIVGQNVLLLDFKSTGCLLGSLLFVS